MRGVRVGPEVRGLEALEELGAEGSVDLLSASDISVRKVSAAKSANLRGNDYDIELSHDIAEGESKIEMSTVLGAGVKATGTLSNTGGAVGKVSQRSPCASRTRGLCVGGAPGVGRRLPLAATF